MKPRNGKRAANPRNKFAQWLVEHIDASGLTYADVGKKLHVGRTAISGHATGLSKPTFMNVVAYCWLFGVQDDPEEIWNLQKDEL